MGNKHYEITMYQLRALFYGIAFWLFCSFCAVATELNDGSNYSLQNNYSLTPVTGVQFKRPASTSETIYSSISRYKDPVLAMFSYNHGAVRQEFDRSLEPIFSPIASQLYLAPTRAEFETKKELYLKDLAVKEVFENSTIGQKIIAAVFDPILLISIWLLFVRSSNLLRPLSLVVAWAGTRLFIEIYWYGLNPRFILETICIYFVFSVIILHVCYFFKIIFQKVSR